MDTDITPANYALAVYLDDESDTMVMFAPLQLTIGGLQPHTDAEAASLARAAVLDVAAKQPEIGVVFAYGTPWVVKTPLPMVIPDGAEEGQVRTVDGEALKDIEASAIKVIAVSGSFPVLNDDETLVDLPTPEELSKLSTEAQRYLLVSARNEAVESWEAKHAGLFGADADRFAEIVASCSAGYSDAFIDLMCSTPEAYSDDDYATMSAEMEAHARVFKARIDLASSQLTLGLRSKANVAPTVTQDAFDGVDLSVMFGQLDAMLGGD